MEYVPENSTSINNIGSPIHSFFWAILTLTEVVVLHSNAGTLISDESVSVKADWRFQVAFLCSNSLDNGDG